MTARRSLTLASAALGALCVTLPMAARAQGTFTIGASTDAAPKVELLDLVATLDKSGNYTMFSKLLMQANLASTLQGSARFTVFAPTDEALAKVGKAKLDSIASDSTQLRHLLQYHIVNSAISANEILKLKDARTMLGSKVEFMMENGRLHVNKAVVLQPDIKASNGVIHGIDSVLWPDKL